KTDSDDKGDGGFEAARHGPLAANRYSPKKPRRRHERRRKEIGCSRSDDLTRILPHLSVRNVFVIVVAAECNAAARYSKVEVAASAQAATERRHLRPRAPGARTDRKSTRLNSSHLGISYAV